VNIYDKYLKLVESTANAKAELDSATSDLDIPDLYIYDQRYTVLFVITEKTIREKGFFISKDLKEQTNLSDKSVERLINFLVKKEFFIAKKGKDKRIKYYYPSKNFHKHLMATWKVRSKQAEAAIDFGPDNFNKILKFFEESKEYPFPNGKNKF
tara:strand:+ start:700 stop:1161 length:462 start_codon:yes stop_codon:yes gene_type:complete